MRWTRFPCSAAVAAVALCAPASAVFDIGGAVCHHDVFYGPRRDLPGEGAGYRGATGGWLSPRMPVAICTHRSGQQLDVYIPDGAPRDAVAVFFIHGGAWSGCYDKGAVPPALLDECIARKWILCSPDFLLQTDVLASPGSAPGREESTFAAMLADIDLAVSRFALLLSRLGFAPSRTAVCGESSGGHLALLYAYGRSSSSGPLPGLRHDIRFDKAVSIAGPVDVPSIDPPPGTGPRMEKLMKRLAGLPDDAGEAEARAALAAWQPLAHVSASSPETVLAYGRIFPLFGTDGIIPVSQAEKLRDALASAGVGCKMRVFPGHHGSVAAMSASWICDRIAE